MASLKYQDPNTGKFIRVSDGAYLPLAGGTLTGRLDSQDINIQTGKLILVDKATIQYNSTKDCIEFIFK